MDKERDEHIAALARVVLYDHEIGGGSNAPEKLAEQVGLPRPATDAGEVELAYAVQVLQQIRRAQAAGDLPDVSGFGELHDHIDANVGWGDVIDGLEHDQWAAVTDIVHGLLKSGALR